MPRMNIAGRVLYSDLIPAAGVKVVIRDLDGTGGREDDRIFNAVADADGRFAGLTDDWLDREGRVFGVDIVDILRLEFTATALDGRSHRGPFLRLDDRNSAPIIFPFPAPKPVSKAERELVQVILLSQNLTGGERALYEFIELASETLAQSTLGGSYRKITTVKGPAATLAGFVAALKAAAGRSGIEAVDLLFTTHGISNKVVLAEGKLPESQVLDALLTLPAAARTKLRMVFSTACFGETHLDTWMAAGFTDASGAQGVYADSAVSYAPFLTSWALQRTFAEAVAAANAADVLDAADNAARAFYTARNKPQTADLIDSTRVRAGTGASRIYT
ncbi:MAG: hypothetical protein ACREIB_13335, partial [Pseudomonadota bacterium]